MDAGGVWTTMIPILPALLLLLLLLLHRLDPSAAHKSTHHHTHSTHNRTCPHLTLFSPAPGSIILAGFAVEFCLPRRAAPGTVRATFTRTGGMPDAYSPHTIVFARAFEAPIHEHAVEVTQMTDAAELASVRNVTSADKQGFAQNLVHMCVYNVTLSYVDDARVNGTLHSVTNAGVHRENWLWLVGVASTIVGSLITATGNVLVKYAHNKNALAQAARAASAGGRSASRAGGGGGAAFVCSWIWWLGWFLMSILAVPFGMIGLATAGQALIMPLGVRLHSVLLEPMCAPTPQPCY